MSARILTINGGSSSLKFALFRHGDPPRRELSGRFERIGTPRAELRVSADGREEQQEISVADHAACVPVLVERLERRGAARLDAIGHRVVHGGARFRAATVVDDAVLEALRELAPFAPEHAPAEIALIEAFGRRHAGVPQVACFDTAFHAALPRVAQLLPIPLRYFARGVRRYGFHGLSYAYLLDALEHAAGAAAAGGRVILAHLGNGASMAAVRERRPVDTTMAFTPAAGLVMGTRAGDLDPGLVAYLARSEGLDAAGFDALVNGASGLLGLSETSADVRDLLAREDDDPRAADALAVFCRQATKWIGALAAVLDGLDTLVFSGGIGEHAAPLRARICAPLAHLGLTIDAGRNAAHAALISSDDSRVAVRVIPTDEELRIARDTAAVCELP